MTTVPAITLLILIVIITLVDWYSVARRLKKVEYFAKPGVMIALLAWLWVVSRFQGGVIWFAIGLACSLVGDVLLVLPREQFIAGLVAFLLAHLFYLVGFSSAPPPINFASLILALVILVVGIQIYRRIVQGLKTSGKSQLKLPILIYSIVISLMLLSALLTLVRVEWRAAPALLVCAGALLFYTSDILLAWNKFVTQLRYRRIPSMVSYHLGQILITLGIALQFLS